MSGFQREWTPQQVQESLEHVNEALPEAQTTDRFPQPGRASGVDVRAGEELPEENATATDPSGSVLRVPPDPPQRATDQGEP